MTAQAEHSTDILFRSRKDLQDLMRHSRVRRHQSGTTPNGRTAGPFNPLSREDSTLFEVLLAGEYALNGFTNRGEQRSASNLQRALLQLGRLVNVLQP